MDEDISDEEIGPSSASRKAAVPEPEVNEHVRVTTPDEVDGVKGERLITPEEERVPSPLEQRVPSYHLENQGPSASEQQVPTTPFEERVPTTLEKQFPTTPLEQPPTHSPLKEQASPPSEKQITLPAEQQQDDARNVWGGPSVVEEPESSFKAGEEEAAQSEELKIPGSFDMEAGPPPHQQHAWIEMLRHLHLKQ